jgi:hypothetical protein
MKFQDINKITQARYRVDIPWTYLESWIENHSKDVQTELEPDFQRAHVWTGEKRIKYVENQLRGGRSGKEIYWNCPGWMRMSKIHGPLQLVDGLQRITAVRKFINNEITAFGYFFKEYEDKLGLSDCNFSFNINDLTKRKDILQWYIDLNDGGVVHTSEEIGKVKKMLEEENG